MDYIILPNAVLISQSGEKPITVAQGDHRYNAVLSALKEGRHDDIPTILDINKAFTEVDGIDLVDGCLYVLGKKAPSIVTQRVLNFKEKGLPYDPLLKFSKKLMENPSYNSREMLYAFLEHNGHPITVDGNFIAYKKVRSDFTDCHTGKMDNSINKVVSMPREEVDDNPNNTCSSGLHVAAYNYANNFSQGHLLEVEVNPKDVVSVPVDYDGEKMRVCAYKVRAVCESRLDDVVLYDFSVDDQLNRWGF
jgi:hypothetical protein